MVEGGAMMASSSSSSADDEDDEEDVSPSAMFIVSVEALGRADALSDMTSTKS